MGALAGTGSGQPPRGGGHTSRGCRARTSRRGSGRTREESPMKRFTKVITVTVAGGVLATALLGGKVVSTSVLDDPPTQKAALTTERVTPDTWIDRKVEALIDKMTTEEKLQQVQLLSDDQVTDEDAQGRRRRRVLADRPARRSTSSSTSPSRSPGCRSRSCSPSTRSTATGRSSRSRWPRPSSFDPEVAEERRHASARASRRPSASSRSTARWSTSRTTRAGAASSRATARTPTSAR